MRIALKTCTVPGGTRRVVPGRAIDLFAILCYTQCLFITFSNLNGQYIKNNTQADAYDLSRGVGWDSESWHEFDYSYKSVTMKIRPSKTN